MIILRDLLKCFEASEIAIIAGEEGVHKEISTTTVVDAPDAYQWLKGKEFILTSGYIFDNNPIHLTTFVKNLIQAGCSGLGIKRGRFVHDFPKEVYEIARAHQFPIVRISNHLVWTDVIAPFYNLKYQQGGEMPVKLEGEMVATIIEASKWSLSGLLKHLTKFFKIPMALVKNNNEPGQNNQIEGVEHIINFLENNPISACLELENPKQEFLMDQGFYFTAFNLSYLQRKEGVYIILASPEKAILQEISKLFVILENFSYGNDNMIASKENFYRNFIYKVISDKITPALISTFEKNLNLNNISACGFFIIVGTNYKEIYKQLEETIRRHKIDTYMIYNSLAKEAVVLIQCTHFKLKESANIFLRKLLVELDESLFSTGDFLAIGDLYGSFEDIVNSYKEALIAKEIGKLLWRKEHIYTYHNLAIYKQFRQKEAIETLNFQDIIQLKESQQTLGFDGIETLETFLEIGNYKKAAASLYIHENTLRYRIQRISQYLGYQMNNPLIKHSLLLKIKLWQLHDKET